MSSNSGSKYDALDNASMTSKSSTSSTAQLIKSKINPFHRSNAKGKDARSSPGEEQAARRAARIDAKALAITAMLK